MAEGITVENIIRSLGLYPDQYIALHGDCVLPIDQALEDGMEIRLIKVVSGG